MASIGEVQGIDAKSATRLRKAGVRTTEGFLRRAATRSGRTALAGETGLVAAELLRWAHHADLMRVKGIGAEYAHLLDGAGAGTVRDLRRRNAKSLTAKMTEVNEDQRIVRRLPTEGMVAAWIEHARVLDPQVRS